MIIQAILLGIVEGLTEFLPISSTGHLIIAERMVGYKDMAELFTVVIQIGAVAAVMWFYREDIIKKVTDLFKGDEKARRFWLNLIIAVIPAGLIGVALDKTLQQYAVPLTVALMLIVGGFIFWLVEEYHEPPRSHKTPQFDKITYKQSLFVGIAQIFSLIPGVSRSGSTIVGGLLAGMDRVTATAFSFYLAIPVMVLATGYKLAKEHSQVAHLPGGGAALIAGTIAAFVSGLFAVKWLLKYVSTHDYKPFAYYRIAAGAVILLIVAAGFISNK
jgi:undecaprenyl-diphosphatase